MKTRNRDFQRKIIILIIVFAANDINVSIVDGRQEHLRTGHGENKRNKTRRSSEIILYFVAVHRRGGIGKPIKLHRAIFTRL